MIEHVCETCAYKQGTTHYVCRRFPPKLGPGYTLRWPVVLPDDFCGEHSALQGFNVELNTEHLQGYLFRFLPKKD